MAKGGDVIKYSERGDIPLVVFADGGTANVLNRYYKKDNNGRDICIMKLQPEKYVMSKFDIAWSDLEEDGGIVREYPADYVHQVKFDPFDPMLWVFCDFNGSDTPVSDLFNEKTGKEKMESLKELIEGLRTENAALRQELLAIQKNLFKYEESNMKRYKMIRERVKSDDVDELGGEEV